MLPAGVFSLVGKLTLRENLALFCGACTEMIKESDVISVNCVKEGKKYPPPGADPVSTPRIAKDKPIKDMAPIAFRWDKGPSPIEVEVTVETPRNVKSKSEGE